MIFRGMVKYICNKTVIYEGLEKVTILLEEINRGIPKSILIDFFNEKIKELDGIKESDCVEITFNVKCKEYKGKYFNNTFGLNCVLAKKYNNNIEYEHEHEYENNYDYNNFENFHVEDITSEEGSPFTIDEILDNERYYEHNNSKEYDPSLW